MACCTTTLGNQQGDTTVGDLDTDAGQIGYDHVGVRQFRCVVSGRDSQYLRPCGAADADARGRILYHRYCRASKPNAAAALR